MANWQERANQENLRQAQEQTTARSAADQDKKEQEALILERLGLFDQLGIQKTLAEIQGDLWKGYGKLSDPKTQVITSAVPEGYFKYADISKYWGWEITQILRASGDIGPSSSTDIFNSVVTSPFGIRSSSLSGSLPGLSYETKPESKQEFGEYTVTSVATTVGTESGTMYSGCSSKKYRGWHDVHVGDRIIGVKEGSSGGTTLSTSLRYLLRSDSYKLSLHTGTIAAFHREIQFKGPEIETVGLEKLVDQAFLDYATKGYIPDFRAATAEFQRLRPIMQANIGRFVHEVKSPL